MFGKKGLDHGAFREDKAETVIGSTCTFKGVIKSDNVVRIYGAVEGEIETAGTLFIGKNAKVMAHLNAYEVKVAGAVRGNINAASSIEILSGGQVYGDIVSPSLTIEAGAIFTGQSTVKGVEEGRLLLEAPLDDDRE